MGITRCRLRPDAAVEEGNDKCNPGGERPLRVNRVDFAMSAIGPLTLEQRTCCLAIDPLAPSMIQAPKSGAVNHALRTQRLRMERHHPNPWGSLPCRFHTGQTRQNCRCCRSMPY